VSYLSPIKIAIRPLHFQIRGRNVGLCISIYDFRGHRIFTSIIQNIIRNVNSVIILYDVSRRDTFVSVADWINLVLRSVGRIPMILVGNKIDLRKHGYDCVSWEEGARYAEMLREEFQLPILFFETSALTGYNVGKVFLVATYLGLKVYVLRRRMRFRHS